MSYGRKAFRANLRQMLLRLSSQHADNVYAVPQCLYSARQPPSDSFWLVKVIRQNWPLLNWFTYSKNGTLTRWNRIVRNMNVSDASSPLPLLLSSSIFADYQRVCDRPPKKRVGVIGRHCLAAADNSRRVLNAPIASRHICSQVRLRSSLTIAGARFAFADWMLVTSRFLNDPPKRVTTAMHELFVVRRSTL